MERTIQIKEFITLHDIIYTPKRFNVIIGPQASGKSLLVKLDYFLLEVADSLLFQAIVEEQRKNVFIKNIKELFSKYFNKNVWKNYIFEISFSFDRNYELIIKREKGKRDIDVFINKAFDDLRKTLLKEFRTKFKKEDPFFSAIEFLNRYLRNNYPHFFKNSVFIPAGRSYFANMDKSIYMILEKNYRIDPFLIIFGSRFENAKSMLEVDIDLLNMKIPKIDILVRNILQGTIVYSKEIENIGIKRDEVFTEIYYTSSGQQESLPLILTLLVLLKKKHKIYEEIIVEEPEAHLFPVSQKAMMELLGYMYNQNFNITITTHSPYIITAINNQILLQEMKDKIPKKSYLYELLDFAIEFDDVSAYSLEDGRLVDIKNYENRLIEGYTVDKVSEEFSTIFNELLEFEVKDD